MGLYVELIKIDKKNENFVYYTYQFPVPGDKYTSTSGKTRCRSKTVSGKLKLDKRNGDVYVIELAESDGGSYANRASLVLIKHWQKGEYPDKAYWES